MCHGAAEKTEAHSPQTTSCGLNACCLPTVPPGTLAAPRTRKLLLLSLGVGPTWFPGVKRKELSMTGRTTAQKPPSPRPLSSTYVDSDFAPTPSSQQPLSSAVETALWPQREGEEKALQCRRSHPGSWGLPFASSALRAVAKARESVSH